jgi:SHS2 domain-containing protein
MVLPSARSYDYFDHDADVGIIGRGPTATAAFEAAADATFALMADPARI